MPAVHDDAICIRHWDWSETSQTVSLFTRAHGVVRALAKGSKRPNTPYSGGIEMLTRAEAGLMIRSSELALLTEWDLREVFPALRRGLPAFNAGMYLADLSQRFVRDHDPHAELFDALLAALRGLSADVMTSVLRCQWAMLREAGYRPTLGDDAPSARTFRFDPVLGGIAAESGAEAEGAWLVRKETVDLLRRVRDGMDGGSQPPEVVVRAARLLGAYIRHVLGDEPRTQELVLGRIPP